MCVDVDQSGGDDLALNFDDPLGLLSGDISCNFCYLAVLDGNVVDTVEVLGRVDNDAALYYQVIHEK